MSKTNSRAIPKIALPRESPLIVPTERRAACHRIVLLQIGWRPFGADSWSRSSILFRLINIVYPMCIFLLLLFNYAYEVISCQGKLNVVTDTKVWASSRVRLP